MQSRSLLENVTAGHILTIGVTNIYGNCLADRIVNLQPDLNFCPECEAKLEYEPGELYCPNCGWTADEVYLLRYEQSHNYGDGEKNP